MNKNGPIIIIEDDVDDQEILSQVFKKHNYKNEIFFFENGILALDFIDRDDVHPFLILSDVNMPKINGFELREQIFTNEKLSLKCIPYLFFTTSASKKSVMDAYSLSVQGFFIKPASFPEISESIRKIVEYWQECFSPNQF